MKFYSLLIIALFTVINITAQTDKEIGEDPSLAKKAEEKAKNRPKTIDVTDNIFMLKGMGGNIAVHHGIDGVFMIDTQFENISESILEEIARKTDRPLQFVLNTHAHGDHTGGNKNFKRKGATIMAHVNVRKTMRMKLMEVYGNEIEKDLDKQLSEIKSNPGAADKASQLENNKERMKEAMTDNMDIDYEQLPAISFSNDMLFHYNDEDIRLIHLPAAHTNGDVAAYFPNNNVLHSGDAFVNGMYPYIDTKNGGSYKGYQRGLWQLASAINNETKVIPGHGSLAKKNDIEKMRTMMKLYFDRVYVNFMNNKTEDEVAQMRDFSKFYDDQGFGDGFITTEKFLRTVYKAVKRAHGAEKAKNEKRAKRIERIKKQDAKDAAQKAAESGKTKNDN